MDDSVEFIGLFYDVATARGRAGGGGGGGVEGEVARVKAKIQSRERSARPGSLEITKERHM